jgi:rhodanese-related sulfurtransferase
LGRGRDGEIEGAIVVAKPDVLDILSRRLRPTSDDQKIVVFCGSVNGSGPVIEALTTAGFDNVVDVQGGFSALRAAGLAVRLPPTPAG